jgi:hypothetical protein
MATALSDDTDRPESRGSGYSDEDDEMTGIRVRGSDPASSGTETQAQRKMPLLKDKGEILSKNALNNLTRKPPPQGILMLL